ncbi:MAG: hypothetical protein E7525_03135 [Ruminococcaceae bacterium]|nr:hypothetical protein [Oscillospiraceae bacterium]
MRISKRNRTTLRTMYVTLFMIFCVGFGLIAVGRIFGVVEQNAFGNTASAFQILNDEEFILFGNKIRLPIIAFFGRVSDFVKQYAPGIIKLLGFAINGAEELIEKAFYQIVSSLK